MYSAQRQKSFEQVKGFGGEIDPSSGMSDRVSGLLLNSVARCTNNELEFGKPK